MRSGWLKLAVRVGACALGRNRTPELVRRSYDRIAAGYDQAWTNHMRELSLAMLDRLGPLAGASCLDLTCGTGFITGELNRRSGVQAVGVDASAGMLAAAREHPQRSGCTFVQADIVAFLRSAPSRSLDVITCGWGLGYSKPMLVVREIARVLRPGGRVGIIDNSLFSLAEVLIASIVAFAEQPQALDHVMRVRFLPSSAMLAAMMRLCGLGVSHAEDGARTYHVADGRAAIDRLTATGAAAGFEFACESDCREQVFERFARVLEQRCATNGSVPITHRYLTVVGKRVEH